MSPNSKSEVNLRRRVLRIKPTTKNASTSVVCQCTEYTLSSKSCEADHLSEIMRIRFPKMLKYLGIFIVSF